jgi:hypothetical protein
MQDTFFGLGETVDADALHGKIRLFRCECALDRKGLRDSGAGDPHPEQRQHAQRCRTRVNTAQPRNW